jgi:hypothetical protein
MDRVIKRWLDRGPAGRRGRGVHRPCADPHSAAAQRDVGASAGKRAAGPFPGSENLPAQRSRLPPTDDRV